MAFSISFPDQSLLYPFDDVTIPAASGLLVLGNEKEYFQSSLYQWRKQDYEAQWRDAIRRVLRQDTKAALIVEYVSPEFATHLVWWPIYRIGNTVYLQNHLLFYDQLGGPFSLRNAFSFLRDRQTKNEDGQAISEWRVSLSEVEEFAFTHSV